ncbi:MAG: nitroreductase family protein [Enterococcus sp.]
MNETIQTLLNHRSYRHFDPNYQIPETTFQEILNASRQAASWMNGQMYSIIVVDDLKIREQFVALNPGNPQMLACSRFLVFVADLQRTKKAAEYHQSPYPVDTGLNALLIATTDASLALQNAVIAAESFGLGTVIVGSIRNQIDEVAQLLNLPDYTIPIAGLCIGQPNVVMDIKPRLPENAVIHYNAYHDYQNDLLKQYNLTMEKFGEARETKLWTQKFADYFAQTPTPAVDHYLQKKKLIQ